MSSFSQPFDLKNTFGAFLIGTFASAILLGVTFLQAFYYFMTYSDGPLIRITVAGLVMLEMGQLAIAIHTIYHYLIINYANPVALQETTWSIDILLGFLVNNQALTWGYIFKLEDLKAVTVMTVHLSYAFRIYHVSGRRKLIPALLVIVSLSHFGTGWVLVASLFRMTSMLDIVKFPETMGKTILASAAAIDTTIACTLSYYLHKKRTGLKETDRLINRLIKYTINTGALTSAMDLVALSLIIGRPKDYLFLLVVLVLASLYSNSLLATFNSRRQVQRDQDVVSTAGGSLAYPTFPLQVMNISESMPGQTHRRGVDDPELQKGAR